jgi:lipopolysaccharide transport system permease protein
MSAGFGDLRADSSGLHVDVRFLLENRSDDVWRRRDGFSLGWQLFEPEGGTSIAEGGRQDLGDELRPGEARAASVGVQLPEEDGRYRVYVSPLTEDGRHCWLDWPFVLLDAVVESGAARVERLEVTTLGALRRQGLAGRLMHAAGDPVLTLWRHRRLILSMARREMAARYRGSVGDLAWTVLHPLLLMLTYFFVFGVVLQARLGGDASRSGFALYFLAGMLPWLAFSEAVGRAPNAVLDNRSFVKKLLFPVETLTVSQAVAALATQGFAMAIFLMVLPATRGSIPATALWAPLLAVPQLLLTLGVCWFLAALGVYLRDLGQIIGFALTLLFFLTPICYPEASLPGWARPVLEKNPMSILVAAYRALLIEGRSPPLLPLAGLTAGSAVVFGAGYAWFQRLRRSFADML